MSPPRQIVGLEWARPEPNPPPGLPISRPRGAKAKGVRYERSVVKYLKLTGYLPRHGQWFSYHDANGPGWCQVDILLGSQGKLFALECKYTYVARAWDQLWKLYKPVVELATQRMLYGLVVCKNLTPEVPPNCIAPSIDDALWLAARSEPCVWHFVPQLGIKPNRKTLAEIMQSRL